MTDKDYKVLAEGMAECYESFKGYDISLCALYCLVLDVCVDKLCDALLVDNAQFDKAAFTDVIAAHCLKGNV